MPLVTKLKNGNIVEIITSELKTVPEEEYNMLSNKLRNESFLAKAPQELVERDRSRTDDLAEGMTKLDNLRQRFREAMAEQDSLN